ncbi:hypothetical protein ABPG72_000497 [Tetrahymena utriculariae]
MSSLGGNKYMSPEVVDKQKPEDPNRNLPPLKSFYRDVMDALKVQESIGYPNNQMRLEPINLLQHLKAFNIDENSLKQLNFPKEEINEIKKEEENDLSKLVIHQYYLDNLDYQEDFDCQSLELQFYKLRPDSSIYQKIQRTLNNFTNITQLVIRIINSDVGNELVEYIANGISKCQKLTHSSQYFSKNKISSSRVRHIAYGLNKCYNINVLKCSFNGNKQLGNQGAQNIAKIIQKQEKITKLTINLADCEIGDSGVKQIAQSIEKNTNLTKLYLNLYNNSLTDYGWHKNSCKFYLNIKKDKLIQIYNSMIENQTISNIAEALKNSTSITKLKQKFLNIHISSQQGKKIADSLQKFQKMTELILKLSQYEDKIAHESISKALQKFELIRKLDLFITDLNFEGTKLISEAIKNYKYISQLRLCFLSNKIGLEGAKIISETVTQLKIEISNSEVIDKLVKQLVEGIQNYKDLTHLSLDFTYNQITDEGVKFIGNALKRYQNTSELQFGFCQNKQLGNEGAKDIVGILQSQHSISKFTLDMKFCEAYDEGIKHIAKSIEKHKKLNKLSLIFDLSHLTPQSGLNIRNAICKYQHITDLYLNFDDSHIDGEGVENIAAAIKNYQHIVNLNFSFWKCQINSEQGKALADSLKNFKNLTKLNLKFDQESGSTGGTSIVQALENLPNIIELSFYITDLNLQGTKHLARAIKNYQNIQKLKIDFGYCTIGKEGVRLRADSIKNCKNINVLDLYFSGEKIIEIDDYYLIVQSVVKYQQIKEVSIRNLQVSQSDIKTIREKITSAYEGIKLYL